MAPAPIVEISGAPDPGPISTSDAIHENEWYNRDFDGYRISEQPLYSRRHLRIISVGAGAAVVGGGSSAVQITPKIQPIVGKLIAFLRSLVWITTGFGAKYAGPGGTNFAYEEGQIMKWKDDPVQYARDVEGELNKRFNQMHLHSNDQKNSRELISNLMGDKLGNDKLAKKMIPDFALGCRRMTPGSRYLGSLSKDNVQVVHESGVQLTETGIVDETGVEHEVEAVICATGFDTSSTPHFKVTGRNGAEIKKQFGDLPVGYLEITAEDFQICSYSLDLTALQATLPFRLS